MLDEEVLQLFVGHIDAHLLEAVPLEPLEPEDVQDADLAFPHHLGSRWSQQLVNPVHDPAEDAVVERLCQRVSSSCTDDRI